MTIGFIGVEVPGGFEKKCILGAVGWHYLIEMGSIRNKINQKLRV